MKILSIRQPWAWWIIAGEKDIENRNWQTDYRGKLLIHVSSFWSTGIIKRDWEAALDCYQQRPLKGTMPYANQEILRSQCGHIIGSVDMVECVKASDSPWFFGRYGFVLTNPRRLKSPIQFKAMLGLLDVPPDIKRRIKYA